MSSGSEVGDMPSVRPDMRMDFLGADSLSMLAVQGRASGRVSHAPSARISRPSSAVGRYSMTPRGSVLATSIGDAPMMIVIEQAVSRAGSGAKRSVSGSSAQSRVSKTLLNPHNLSQGGGRRIVRGTSNLARPDSSSSDEDDTNRRQRAFKNLSRRPSSVGIIAAPSTSNTSAHHDEGISQTASIIVRGDVMDPDAIQHEIVLTEFVEDSDVWTRLFAFPKASKAFKHSSLYLFQPTNKLRGFLYNVSSSKYFEVMIFIHILVNCAVLMATDPAQQNLAYEDALDYYFVTVFSLEAMAKIVSLGFILHEHAYMRDSWNVVDFIIVCLSFANLIPGVANLTALRTVRVLRAFRSISSFGSLRVVARSVTKSLPALMNVVILQFFLLSTFAIGGVQLFKGNFRFKCVDDATRVLMSPQAFCKPGNEPGLDFWGYGCPDGFSCANVGNGYADLLNFDSYPQAFSLLFTVMTFDQWPAHLIHSLHVFGELSFLYYFLFIVFAAFVAPNLALAIINDKFITVHDREAFGELDETTLLGRLAQKAVVAMKVAPFESGVSEGSPSTLNQGGESEATGLSQESDSGVKQKVLFFQARVFEFVEGYPKPMCASEHEEARITPYRIVLAVCMVLNAVLLATLHYGQPEWLTSAQIISNRVFTGIFVLDCIIKLFAMGPRFYAAELFNVFDLLITLGSLIELGISGSSIAVIFRTFRLFRLITIFNRFKHLRKVLRSLVTAMKETLFLNTLVGLFLIVSGLVGMQLFGYSWGSRPTAIRPAFTDIWGSILIAFQIMTLDGWVPIMVHAVDTTSYAAVLYFMVCVLLGHYVILNLFKAILIGAFDEEDIIEELQKDAIAEEIDLEEQREKFIRTLSFQAMHIRKAKYEQLTYLDDEEMVDVALPTPHRFIPTLLPGTVGGGDIGHTPTHRGLGLHDDAVSRIGMNNLNPESALDYASDNRSVEGYIRNEPSLSARQGLSCHEGPHSRSQSQSLFCDSDALGSDMGLFPSTLSPFCENCGQHMYLPLPPVLNLKRRTAGDIHQRMCNVMRQRSERERFLKEYSERVNEIRGCDRSPTLEFAQHMLGMMWTKGLMLGIRVEDILPNSNDPSSDPWNNCYAILEEELSVLGLRTGEELVGRAFASHAIKCIPPLTFGWYITLRGWCTAVVENPWFERLMLLCIIASSALVAMDSPRETRQEVRVILVEVDTGFTAIFCIEMVMKIVAFGIFKGNGYFRDPFNWLDCLVVLISVISISITSVSFGFLKVLRVFRALRPLRLITRNRSLQAVVLTLFKSIKGVLSVSGVLLLNLVVFGIFCLHLFNGSFFRCTDASITVQENCTGMYFVEPNFSNVTGERMWVTAPRNFDNFGNALLTLFEVSTLEWWTDVMWDCVDAVGHGRAPEKDRNVWYTFVFMLFVILSSFVFMQLFVAVMMSSFLKVQSALGGISFVTPEQRMWAEAQRILLQYEPGAAMFPLNNPVSKFLFAFMSHQAVELFLYFLVCLNVAVMCVDYYGRPKMVNEVWAILNDSMSAFFISKLVLLFPALGLRYFLDPWNRLDFVLVSSTIANIILRETTTIDVSILQVFYIFRLLRMLRILKRFKGIRILFEVILYSLTAIVNVGSLLLVLMFLFAVIGMQLFYNIDRGILLNNQTTNFFNFWNSFQMTFRFVTLTDWNKAMHDCMVQTPFCETSPENTCGTAAAPLYFVLFIFFAVYVLVNLLAAAILDNFNTASHMERSELHFNDIQRFLTSWTSLDRDATMLIKTQKFALLASRLKPPMGFVRKTSRVDFLQLCARFSIPDHCGQIHFLEILIPMARHMLGVELPHDMMLLQDRAWRGTREDISSLPIVRTLRGDPMTIHHYFAALMIQTAFRRFVARSRFVKIISEKRTRNLGGCLGVRRLARARQRSHSVVVEANEERTEGSPLRQSGRIVDPTSRLVKGSGIHRLRKILQKHTEDESDSDESLGSPALQGSSTFAFNTTQPNSLSRTNRVLTRGGADVDASLCMVRLHPEETPNAIGEMDNVPQELFSNGEAFADAVDQRPTTALDGIIEV